MTRCVRIWTGADGNSVFEEGMIDLPLGQRGDLLCGNVPAAEARRFPTPSGPRPHSAGVFVISEKIVVAATRASASGPAACCSQLLLAAGTHAGGGEGTLSDPSAGRRNSAVARRTLMLC